MEKLNSLVALSEGEYTVLDGQKINWKGSALTKSHIGTLDIHSSTLSIKEGLVSGSAEFALASIKGDAGDSLDQHLLSDDFFAAEKYPHGSFSFDSTENGAYLAQLSLKDQTHSVSFSPRITQDADALNMKAKVTFDRTLWGINYGSESALGALKDKAISDDIEVTLDIDFIKTKEL